MESLQLAQMLADLSSLNTTEPNAAAALVTANKAIDTVEKTVPPAAPRRPTDELRRAHTSHTSRPGAGAGAGTGAASPARIDKFGRRMMMSPPVLSRSNSAQGSVPGTPRGISDGEDDLDRASTLMALYEIRAKLKQQDNSSLMKAREKIADLASRQQQQQQHGSGKKESEKTPSRFTFPK